MNSSKKIYNILKRKYSVSFGIFVALTLTGFIVSAVMIMLNLYAIRYNPAFKSENVSKGLKTQLWCFIAIAIITAVQAFISGVIALFTFKKTYNYQKNMISDIKFQIDNYKKLEDGYTKRNRDQLLLDKVTEIISQDL